MLVIIIYALFGYLLIGVFILGITLIGLHRELIRTLYETEEGHIFDLRDHFNCRWIQFKVIVSWPIAFLKNKH